MTNQSKFGFLSFSRNSQDIQANYLSSNLINACVVGDIVKIKELIALGADVNSRDCLGRTVIMYAAILGDVKIVEFLIENNAIFITSQEVTGKTALWFAAANGRLNCVKYLLNHGAKMTADLEQISPLWIAAAKGHLEIVKICLQQNFVGLFSNKNGICALTIADLNQHYKIVECLAIYLDNPYAYKERKSKLSEIINQEYNKKLFPDQLDNKFYDRDPIKKISKQLNQDYHVVTCLHQLAKAFMNKKANHNKTANYVSKLQIS